MGILWCLALQLVATSSTNDVVDLLQQRRMVYSTHFNHTSPTALEDLALKLLHVKTECLQSGLDCLPTLKQVRYRVWPFVQNLLGEQYQGFDPVDFHPQVAKAKLNCDGRSDHSMVYMHLWKAAGYSLMENLKTIGSDYQVVDSFEDDFNWCENIDLDSIQSRTTFTFVREPLGRFISGYAEIDRIYLGPRYEFFHQAEEGSVKRAQLFVERFFQDGLIFNGHVKPQSEYFAPFSPSCRLPIDFVGKIEHLSDDWKRLLESNKCDAANISYNGELGQHPTDARERQAMNDFLESSDTADFLTRDRENMTTSSIHLQNILSKKGNTFLRAFCWISLPDYVMFDYDLPKQCDDTEMLQVMEMIKKQQINSPVTS